MKFGSSNDPFAEILGGSSGSANVGNSFGGNNFSGSGFPGGSSSIGGNYNASGSSSSSLGFNQPQNTNTGFN